MPMKISLGLCASLSLSLLLTPAWALFKLVHPDGSVTYSDRPPPSGAGRVTSISAGGDRVQAAAALPLALRQAVQRHPVTLFTAVDCPPCDSARQWLVRRGVPYSERRVVSEDDARVLERLSGGRTVPALNIGAQPLRGFSDADWTVFLDAAGYPRESQLPASWQAPVAAPLANRTDAPPPVPLAPPPRAVIPLDPPAPGQLRF